MVKAMYLFLCCIQLPHGHVGSHGYWGKGSPPGLSHCFNWDCKADWKNRYYCCSERNCHNGIKKLRFLYIYIYISLSASLTISAQWWFRGSHNRVTWRIRINNSYKPSYVTAQPSIMEVWFDRNSILQEPARSRRPISRGWQLCECIQPQWEPSHEKGKLGLGPNIISLGGHM